MTAPRKPRPLASGRQLTLYLAPAVALVALFLVFPLIFTSYMSFTEWAGLGPAQYIGLDNFVTLYHDSAFREAFTNTIWWVLIGLVVHTPLCVLVALVLHRKPRFWKFFRTAFFLPNVISSTALAFLWYFVFHVSLGLVNKLLAVAGLESWQRNWLFDPHTALWATMLPFVIYIGFGMVLFLTQISTIPGELFEAAELDGASAWRQDWSITIPLIRRAIALQAVFVVGYALRMFEYPFIMTGGGPADHSMTLSLYIYQQMVTANRYGLSMAAGLVTLALGAVLMLGVFAVLRRTEK
ncbi:carbohydrate ABC transporter permease [Actinoplanes sp. RD1]|uniref:carbohydrate ABC transporter permease n=1 Tax=Actinoplanes sp. RD1 TaxID=3064538 RepID=UPI0027404CC2|nr:sugar ABC transporter permease [Actinoplanes sp. RD1]